MGILGSIATVALTLSLHVDGTDAGMQGLQMFLDGNSAGVVGDTLTLTPGAHRLTIDINSGLLVAYDLVVREGSVEVRPTPDPVCSGYTSWSFVTNGKPTVESRSPSQMRLKLVDPEPVFTGVCQVDLPNLSCLDRVARVRIDSTPEAGAALWVGNIPIGYRTPADLNVRFCAGTGSRFEVELRKPGFESCTVSVDLEDGAGLRKLSYSLRKVNLPGRNPLTQCKEKPAGELDVQEKRQSRLAVDMQSAAPV